MRSFHFDVFVDFYFKILPYIWVTACYVFFSILFGFLFGALLTKARLGNHKILGKIAETYITIIRCVPSIVMLFLVYYGLPILMTNLFGWRMENVGAIIFVIITFSLFLGASSSEIMRSAYLSVNKGQREAAVMVGHSEWDAFRRIVFPQALHAAIPNVGNICIYMMKEGALAYTIGLHDVLGRGYYLNGLKANTYSLETYIALALIYWPCTMILEKIFAFLEKRGEVK